MAVQKKGKYWYGTSAHDTEAEVLRYSTRNRYPAAGFRHAACPCGSQAFRLASDENAGAARRTCTQCGTEHWMGDSELYASEAELESHECICDGDAFHLLSAVALYPQSNDVRWYYIGCYCPNCHLVGVFADWKCEAGEAQAFLANT